MYRYDSSSGRRVYILEEADHRTTRLFGLIEEAIAVVSSGMSLNSLEVYFRHHYNDNLVSMTGIYTGMRELYLDIDNSTLRDRATLSALNQLIKAAPNLMLLAFAAGRNSKRPIPSSYLESITKIFNITTTSQSSRRGLLAGIASEAHGETQADTERNSFRTGHTPWLLAGLLVVDAQRAGPGELPYRTVVRARTKQNDQQRYLHAQSLEAHHNHAQGQGEY
jgi:hypothetical protein